MKGGNYRYQRHFFFKAIKYYYKELYANEFDNLDEREKFLQRTSYQVNTKTENLKTFIFIKYIELIIKKFSTKKTSDLDDFIDEIRHLINK